MQSPPSGAMAAEGWREVRSVWQNRVVKVPASWFTEDWARGAFPDTWREVFCFGYVSKRVEKKKELTYKVVFPYAYDKKPYTMTSAEFKVFGKVVEAEYELVGFQQKVGSTWVRVHAVGITEAKVAKMEAELLAKPPLFHVQGIELVREPWAVDLPSDDDEEQQVDKEQDEEEEEQDDDEEWEDGEEDEEEEDEEEDSEDGGVGTVRKRGRPRKNPAIRLPVDRTEKARRKRENKKPRRRTVSRGEDDELLDPDAAVLVTLIILMMTSWSRKVGALMMWWSWRGLQVGYTLLCSLSLFTYLWVIDCLYASCLYA